MFDILYEQTFTMQWKYLAALLDMFNPRICRLPDDNTVDEMIEAGYIIYVHEKREFHLPDNFRVLIDSFFETNTAVNIEAPIVKEMGATLSLYYLNNQRHMLVLIYTDKREKENNLVEIAISSKTSSSVKVFEKLGANLITADTSRKAESFDTDTLPEEYKNSYDAALKNNKLFRVTLYNQETDGSNGVLAVFAAFPSMDNCIWITAMRQKFSKKEKPIIVEKLSKRDYQKQLITFFKLFEKQIR